MHVGQFCNVVVRAAADEFTVASGVFAAENSMAPEVIGCLIAESEYVEEAKVGRLEKKALVFDPALVMKLFLGAPRTVVADEENAVAVE